MPQRKRRFAGAVYITAAVVALVGAALILASIAAAGGWLPELKPIVSGSSSGTVATFTVAGATLLLADFTALLAWFTAESLAATSRAAGIAEAALVTANRQADIADKSLKAVQEQAKIAERQVDATNTQAQVAKDQLVASWRPILADPLAAGTTKAPPRIEIRPTLDKSFEINVALVNIGVGPAFVKKGLLALGVAINFTRDLGPKILPPGAVVILVFTIDPTKGSDIAITNALLRGDELQAGAMYHDISGEHAWRSRGRLLRQGTYDWQLLDVEVADIDLTLLS